MWTQAAVSASWTASAARSLLRRISDAVRNSCPTLPRRGRRTRRYRRSWRRTRSRFIGHPTRAALLPRSPGMSMATVESLHLQLGRGHRGRKARLVRQLIWQLNGDRKLDVGPVLPVRSVVTARRTATGAALINRLKPGPRAWRRLLARTCLPIRWMNEVPHIAVGPYFRDPEEGRGPRGGANPSSAASVTVATRRQPPGQVPDSLDGSASVRGARLVPRG